MAKFLYKAKALDGQTQVGQLEANDEAEVRVRLRSKQLTPVQIVRGTGPSAGAAKTGGFKLFEARVPQKDLLIFTRQFSTLINAGIPIVECLRILSEGKRNPLIKESAAKVKQSIEAGKRLAESLALFPNVFDRFYVNMVRAGEEAGILDNILLRLATYMEKSDKIKKQVKGAMFYPAAILVVAALVITGILVFIIPKFQDMYKQAGGDLPYLTQIVVGISHFMINRWYVVIGGVVVIPWLLINYYKTEAGKEFFDRFFISMPLVGELVQKSAVAKMTRTLSTLLQSGVSVIDALDIASKTAGNKVIEEALLRSKQSVTQGRQLTTPLAKEKLIPDMVVQMIGVGEQSGTMDTMLAKVADFYEDDVENVVKALTTMIEPIMMVFLGGTIAVLVVAMYLPIFGMANLAGG